MQVELNRKHDWSAIGGDANAKQAYGKRCAGLVNMGNTPDQMSDSVVLRVPLRGWPNSRGPVADASLARA